MSHEYRNALMRLCLNALYVVSLNFLKFIFSMQFYVINLVLVHDRKTN